jgi:AcrR family transcriptional regulator
MTTTTPRKRGQATRDELIASAREQFGRQGYEAASIEAVLQDVGVSRGALYHHFANKEDLFLAVLHDVEQDIATAVHEAARAPRDPAERMRAGCRAWLELAQDPAVQRITLIDAPSVIGWEAWRDVDEQHLLSQLRRGVAALAAGSGLAPELVDAISHILLAALNEAALYAARGTDDAASFENARDAVDELLRRLLCERHDEREQRP